MNLSVQLNDQVIEAIALRVAEIVGRDEAQSEPWIGVTQAAEHLACDPRRIYDLKAQGAIPFAKDGSRLLFRRSELDAALERIGGEQ